MALVSHRRLEDQTVYCGAGGNNLSSTAWIFTKKESLQGASDSLPEPQAGCLAKQLGPWWARLIFLNH